MNWLFKKKNNKKVDDEIFFPLAPLEDVDVDEGDIYFNSFMEAINHKSKIIAFTGRYGIGKTSIINSILNKMDKSYKNIRISLGNYKQEKAQESEIASKEIEMKILQQILYTFDENKLPMSRFKRIKYINERQKFTTALMTCVIMLLVNIYFPKIHDTIFAPIYNIIEQNFSFNIIVIVLCVIEFVIFFCIYRLICTIQITLNNLSLKYKDLEITINNKNDKSIFNKYLDEIVYFFKQTKTKILVIEDLDRYEKISLEIFKKLKELNFLLNSNETIKNNGGVIFIYALRDDLFIIPEDRVKFFDNIIPVVSKFSSQNAKQYIVESYEKIKNKYTLEINENLFSILSLHIQDRRLLNNIFMEFKTYINALKDNQDIDYTQLFAIISYKNINPLDFEKRLANEGNLYNIFEFKRDIIKSLIDKVTRDNDIIIEEMNEAKSQKIKDLKDLKKSFLLDVLKNEYTGNYINKVKIRIDNEELSLDGFINNDIDIDDLKNKEMQWCIQNYSLNRVKKEFIEEFILKVEKLNYDFEKYEDKIVQNNKKIEKYQEMTMEEILNLDRVDEILTDEEYKKIFKNKVLISLVKNGYIKENYERNLSYFKSGDLTHDDYSFLISVDTKEKLNYYYELKNVEKIVNMIQAKDFKQETVLNIHICDYLIDSKITNKKNHFYSQFKEMNEYKLKFLDEYCNYDENKFIKLIKEIFNDEIIIYIFNNTQFIKDKNNWLKLMFENLKFDLKKESCIELRNFVEQNIDFINNLKINQISTSNVNYLNPRFDNYDKLSLSIIELLYKNKVYSANKSFYNKLIDLYELDNSYKDSNVINVLFENEFFEDFRESLIEEKHFEKFYSEFKIYNSNEMNIIKAINHSNLEEKEKILILEKEEEKIINIQDVKDDSLCKKIVVGNYLEVSMQNVLYYYNLIQEIDDNILNMLFKIGNDYNVIDSEEFKSFELDLIYSPSNIQIKYNLIASKFDLTISSFKNDLELNEDFVEELIEVDKVILNVDTYNYLYTKNISLLSKLIIRRFNEFLDIKNKVEQDRFIIDKIINSEVDINEVIKLLDVIDIELISKRELSILITKIINQNVALTDDNINEIFSILPMSDKIKYFIYLHKCSEENIKYLYKIDEKISKIRNGTSTCITLEEDDDIYDLMIYLKNKKIINSFERKNGKIRVTYNKSKIYW